MFIPVEFVSLQHDHSGSPVALLREINGSRELRMSVSLNDASQIAILSYAPAEGLVGDLSQDIITALGATLSLIRVVPEKDRIVKCEMFLEQNGKMVQLTPRPGEAIVLAILNDASISVDENLFALRKETPTLKERIRKKTTIDFGTYRHS